MPGREEKKKGKDKKKVDVEMQKVEEEDNMESEECTVGEALRERQAVQRNTKE